MSDAPDRELLRTEASLVDILDRTLNTGVALRAEIALTIAGIELVTIDLRAVLASTSNLRRHERPIRDG